MHVGIPLHLYFPFQVIVSSTERNINDYMIWKIYCIPLQTIHNFETKKKRQSNFKIEEIVCGGQNKHLIGNIAYGSKARP